LEVDVKWSPAWDPVSCQRTSVLHGRLERVGDIVELTVDESLLAGYSPESNDVSTEDEESQLLGSVNRQRLLKTNKLRTLACS
jgi:hypothetical protein